VKNVMSCCLVMGILAMLAGCGKKAGLEGMVVDGLGLPMPNVRVVAMPEEPQEGCGQFAMVTDESGRYHFDELCPLSRYILVPQVEHMVTKAILTVTTSAKGETLALADLMIRFLLRADGIVTDTKTGLQWVAGPDRGTTWDEADIRARTLSLDGGGWRMPSMEELRGLYKKGAGLHGIYNITPLIKTTGFFVWSGDITHGGTSVKCFNFHDPDKKFKGKAMFGNWIPRTLVNDSNKTMHRGFAVRLKPQSP